MMAVVPRFTRKSDPAGKSLVLPDSSKATIRYTRPADRNALLAFHRRLSDTTVYMRYFSPASLTWRTGSARIADDLCNDPGHHLTLIVERCAPGSGVSSIVGVGRLIILGASHATAEFAMTIRDDFQGMGLGTALLDALINTARSEGLHTLVGSVLNENYRMLQLCREHGFHIVSTGVGGPVAIALDLRA